MRQWRLRWQRLRRGSSEWAALSQRARVLWCVTIIPTGLIQYTFHFCNITGFCILISFKLPFFATAEIGVSLGYIPSLHRTIFSFVYIDKLILYRCSCKKLKLNCCGSAGLDLQVNMLQTDTDTQNMTYSANSPRPWCNGNTRVLQELEFWVRFPMASIAAVLFKTNTHSLTHSFTHSYLLTYLLTYSLTQYLAMYHLYIL